MGRIAQIFILLCGVVFIWKVVTLLIKRRLNERNSIIWLTGTIIILVLSANPDILDWTARLIGIKYPPSLLFLLSNLVLLYISLSQSIQISILHEQLKELTQIIAVDKSINHEEVNRK